MYIHRLHNRSKQIQDLKITGFKQQRNNVGTNIHMNIIESYTSTLSDYLLHKNKQNTIENKMIRLNDSVM